MAKRIIAGALCLALLFCLAGCGGKAERNLGQLLSAIEPETEGKEVSEALRTAHIKIKKRVASFSYVDTHRLKLEDYLGDVYSREATVLLFPEPLETCSCRIYRVIGEVNQRYLIIEDGENDLSLWHFEKFHTEFDGDYGQKLLEAYEKFFPGCDLSKASEKELRKLIHGTGHELLINSTADANAVFQARAHLDGLRADPAEDKEILGLPKTEQSALKLGTPCTLYHFNGDAETSGEPDIICPVLYEGAITGLISLGREADGSLSCSLARSFGPALEELRFSQALDFDSGIVLAQVEDKIIVTDGAAAVILEDKPNPGKPSISPEKLEALAPLIREAVSAEYAEVTRSLG